MTAIRAFYKSASLMVVPALFLCDCSGRQPGGDEMRTDTTAGRFATVMEGLEGGWITTRFNRALHDTRSVFRAIDQGQGKRPLWLDVRSDSASCQFVYSFDLYDSALDQFDSLRLAGHAGIYALSLHDGNAEDTIGIFGGGKGFYWRNHTCDSAAVDSLII